MLNLSIRLPRAAVDGKPLECQLNDNAGVQAVHGGLWLMER